MTTLVGTPTTKPTTAEAITPTITAETTTAGAIIPTTTTTADTITAQKAGN